MAWRWGLDRSVARFSWAFTGPGVEYGDRWAGGLLQHTHAGFTRLFARMVLGDHEWTRPVSDARTANLSRWLHRDFGTVVERVVLGRTVL